MARGDRRSLRANRKHESRGLEQKTVCGAVSRCAIRMIRSLEKRKITEKKQVGTRSFSNVSFRVPPSRLRARSRRRAAARVTRRAAQRVPGAPSSRVVPSVERNSEARLALASVAASRNASNEKKDGVRVPTARRGRRGAERARRGLGVHELRIFELQLPQLLGVRRRVGLERASRFGRRR